MPTFIEENDDANGIPGGRLPKAEDLIKFARADAADIGIDPDVAERRIRVESRGISNALSPKGAFGAAQLMPDTAEELSRRYGGDPRDPYDNVRLGNRYYKEQLDRYGNDTLAAAAYNAGPGAVDRHGGVPPYRETRDYVAKVANGRAGGVRIPNQDRKPFDPYADWSAKGEWEIAEPIRNAGPAADGRQEPSALTQEDSGKPWLSREWERQKGNLSIAWNGMMNAMDGHVAAGLGELISSRQGKALNPVEKAEDDNNRREFDAAMSRIQGRNSESSALQGKARPETQEFMGASGGGWNWNTAAKIGDALIKNPVGVTGDVIVQSSLPSLAGMATAILARFSGGSANAAALAGGLGGSAFIEFGNEYAENRANGMPHDRAWAAAGAKSTVVGTLDAVSFKTAGSALEGVLSKSGFGRKAGIVGKEVGRQAFLGAVGDAGGSLAAGKEPDPVSVVSEAIAEVGGAPGEALSTFRRQKSDTATTPPADTNGGPQDPIPADEILSPADPDVGAAPVSGEQQPPEAQPQPSVQNVPEPSRALPPIEIARGSPTTFSTEDGVELNGDFALVDADQLIASHDINLRKNPLFPDGLQPRQRERAASELQISNIVSKINPARLGASPDVANGAPIIGGDGVVESGNGRTIALQRVYQANGAKAAAYRQWLKDHADEFGIDAANVDSLSKPILVRVRNTQVDRAEFARQANTSTVAAMSTGELANSDAARIGNLEDLVLTEDGDITGAANRPFVNRFVSSLAPAEQSGLLDAQGRLSQAGYSRVRNAILARAYGDSPVLMRMTESVDGNLRNLTTVLTSVAPRVAKARESIAAGAMHDADLTSDLLSAVEELSQLKSDGRSVKEYLAQQDLVGDKLTVEGRELIAFLDDNLRAPKRIAAFIVDYFDVLAGFGNPAQESLFGTEQSPQRSQIIALAKEKQNAEPVSAESKPEPETAKPAPKQRAEPSGNNQTADQAAGEQERAQGGSESTQPAAVDEWLTFGKESGSLGIPRADMPQIKAAHRGALTQFLAGRGIEHENVEVDPKSLFPTQSEFNPAKVQKWRDRKGQTDRSLLISSDNYILDGHHQWLAALADGDASEGAIRFSAPIRDLLAAAAEFPSVGSAPGNQASPPAFSLESQTEKDLANKESRAQDESIADRETADREREVFALTSQAPEKTAGPTSQSGLFTPDGRATEAAGQKPQAEAQPAVQPIVEHVTARGKTIRGVIRNDLTKEQAKAIDPFTFRKDGGWFIRERYIDFPPQQKAPEPAKKAPEHAKQKETTPPKPDAKAEKLAHQVRVLREQGTLHVRRADEDYGRNRNTNTARRARMAASAEADAAERKQIGETMLKLADALESGSAPELSGLTTRAQIELIDRIMLNAMDKRDQKEFSFAEQERRRGRPFDAADLKYVEYPRASWLDNARTNLTAAIKGMKGSVELARKIMRSPYFTEKLNADLKKLIDDKKIKDAVGWWAVESIQRVSRLERSGIRDLVQLQAAVKRYAELRADKMKPDAIKEAERALVGSKVGIDFFPTPAAVARRMVETAGIEPGMSVLEPSAGNGNIAEEIRKAGVEPDVVEISESLRKVLKFKGFNIVGHDFNDTEGKYDRIVMNPPFSKNQDIEHVQRAYGMLKPGGRLVAIVGEGAFSRSGKTEQAFRDWLDSAGAEIEKLPAGTFNDKSLLAQTGANARIVVIEAGASLTTEVASQENPSVEQRTKRDEYTRDLFGNQIPDNPVPSTSGKQPAPATPGDLHAAGAVPGAEQTKRAATTRLDALLHSLITEGKPVSELLSVIERTATKPFQRELANRLSSLGLDAKVVMSTAQGRKFTVGRNASDFSAGYDPRTNEVLIFRPGNLATNILHELMHAATYRAIRGRGDAALRMKALWMALKKHSRLSDPNLYHMSDVDEFVAAVFTDSGFRNTLQQIDSPFPERGLLRTAWDAFVDIVRNILGLPAQRQNALAEAMNMGEQLMREQHGERSQSRHRSGAGQDTMGAMYIRSDDGSLRAAQDDARSGMRPINVWRKHGWLVFDGQWRRAIASDEARLVSEIGKTSKPLAEVFSFPQLQELYPDVYDAITVRMDKSPYGDYAWFDPVSNEIVISDALSKDMIRAKLIHEIQHAIQSADLRDSGTSPVDDRVGSYMAYVTNVGEIEARDAENTADMTASDMRSVHTPSLLDENYIQAIALSSGNNTSDRAGTAVVPALINRTGALAIVKGARVLPEISEAHDDDIVDGVSRNAEGILTYLKSLGIQAVAVRSAQSKKIMPDARPKDAFEYEGAVTYGDWRFRRVFGTPLKNDPKPVIVETVAISVDLERGSNAIMAESVLQDAGFQANAVGPTRVTIDIGFRPGRPTWDLNGARILPIEEFIDTRKKLTRSSSMPDRHGDVLGNVEGSARLTPEQRAKVRIVGEARDNYTQDQRDFFRRVGRTIDKPALQDRIKALQKDAWKKLATGLVDQFRPLRDISELGYTLARLSKGHGGALEALLHHGKLKLTDNVYDADTSGGVIEKLGVPLHGEFDDFLWWVASNRAERLSTEDREHLFTPADITAGKSLSNGTTTFDYTLQHGPHAGLTTRSRTEIYKDAIKTFDAFNKNVMDMAEQSGLIDATTRPFWEHEFYVPFYRVSENEGEFVGPKIGGGLVRQYAFKQLKGGTDKLNADLLANTLQNWNHLIAAAAKNRAAKESLVAASSMGIAIEGPEVTMHQMAKAVGTSVLSFMDQGTRRFFIVDDPLVYTALTSLEYAGMRSPLMDAMGKFKHWLTIGVTASPAFKVRNLIRDSIHAIGTSDLSTNPLKNLKEGIKATERSSQDYVSMLASGGLIRFGTMLEGKESDRVRNLVRQGVKDSTILNSPHKLRAFYDKFLEPAIEAYNELGNRGEEINRAALYQQLRAQGVDHAQASLMARDLMDFSMQGTWASVRFLTQVVPFMNARLQGLYKLGRAGKENPGRLAAVIGATSLASLALLLAYRDDDDWKAREDWDRNNYWWFKFGGLAFRIPKPFEVGAIATMAERGWELFFDPEMTGKRFMKNFWHLLGDQLAMNPTPQMIKPIIDIYANKDSFSGRPIESMGMERLDPEYRYTASTSMPSRALSTLTGGLYSPVQYDHMLRGYFGWLGSFVVGGADLAVRAVSNEPARPEMDYWKFATQGFVKELPSGQSRYVSQMYEQAQEIEQAYGTYRAIMKRGRINEAREYREAHADTLAKYRQVEFAKRVQTKINAQIRQIENGSLPPAIKKARIKELRQRQDRSARELATRLKYGAMADEVDGQPE